MRVSSRQPPEELTDESINDSVLKLKTVRESSDLNILVSNRIGICYALL